MSLYAKSRRENSAYNDVYGRKLFRQRVAGDAEKSKWGVEWQLDSYLYILTDYGESKREKTCRLASHFSLALVWPDDDESEVVGAALPY